MSLVEEDQESGLEGILRIMRIPQHAAAYIQDHWSMAFDQHFECRGIRCAGELNHQLSIILYTSIRPAAGSFFHRLTSIDTASLGAISYNYFFR